MIADTNQENFAVKVGMQSPAAQAGRFLSGFVEMQIPMVLGALVCFLLGRLIPASSGYAAAYHPGTYLYAAGDILFLTVPVVAWKMLRGHGRRQSLEMAAAMIAPVTAIIVWSELTAYPYLTLLVFADYPAMCLGMLGYMLYRRSNLGVRSQIPSRLP